MDERNYRNRPRYQEEGRRSAGQGSWRGQEGGRGRDWDERRDEDERRRYRDQDQGQYRGEGRFQRREDEYRDEGRYEDQSRYGRGREENDEREDFGRPRYAREERGFHGDLDEGRFQWGRGREDFSQGWSEEDENADFNEDFRDRWPNRPWDDREDEDYPSQHRRRWSQSRNR